MTGAEYRSSAEALTEVGGILETANCSLRRIMASFTCVDLGSSCNSIFGTGSTSTLLSSDSGSFFEHFRGDW